MLNLTIKSLTLSALLTMFWSHAALASSTTEVWDHHIKAWADRSVEAILEDYSEDSVLILNNQIFKRTDVNK